MSKQSVIEHKWLATIHERKWLATVHERKWLPMLEWIELEQIIE